MLILQSISPAQIGSGAKRAAWFTSWENRFEKVWKRWMYVTVIMGDPHQFKLNLRMGFEWKEKSTQNLLFKAQSV